MEAVLQVVMGIWDIVSPYLIFINMLLSIVVVFFQRKDPQSVWLWLMVLNFIPIVGFIFYLLIGGDMHKRKMFL